MPSRRDRFKVVGKITEIETVAANLSIRDLKELRKLYGKGRWRKLKGVALVEAPSGDVLLAELHWYEAHGIGRKDMKVKRYLE